MAHHKTLLKQLAIVAVGVIIVGYLLYRHFSSRQMLHGYYTVGVILNYNELTTDDMQLIRATVRRKLSEINQLGGLAGRELRVKYLNDKGTAVGAREAVRQSMSDAHLAGYVGCWSSTRTKAISELIGPAGIPLIGGYALTPLFRQYPNMFTAERSIANVVERLDLYLSGQVKRPAFIGLEQDLYSIALQQRLNAHRAADPSVELALVEWYPADHTFTDQQLDSLVQQLQQRSDFLLLSLRNSTSSYLIGKLRARGLQIPIFTGLGDLGFVLSHSDTTNLGELYDLNVVGVPGTYNLRLQQRMSTFIPERHLDDATELKLSFAARIADSIGLMAEAGRDADQGNLHQGIVQGLHEYIGGRRIYRGWFDDWYFTEDRSFAGDVLLVWKPRALKRHILAPQQYMQLQDTLKEVLVVYTHIDITEINRIDDIKGLFQTTFYLELTSAEPFRIEQLDFTNVALSSTEHKSMLDVKLISETRTAATAGYNYLYKITGTFQFEPNLKNYPFDEQQFPISFQPASALAPFLIQPSAQALHDTIFDLKGWNYQDQFVGYNHDIISFIDSFNDEKHNLPLFKFSYTYVLERARADFFLKVLTPLLVILTVTYFSVFIPLHRFETLEAIQVTSLLASIALYFSTYKPEMEYATVSDKIFVFTYIMITSLIGTSIRRFVRCKAAKGHEFSFARVYQYYIYPLIILVFTLLMV